MVLKDIDYNVKKLIDNVVYHKISIVGLLIFSLVLVYQSYTYTPPSIKTGVYFLNVGQGDSTLYITKGNNNILIDTGNRCDDLKNEIHKILGDVKRIDVLFLTHPDSDHDGCTENLQGTYSVGKIFVSPIYLSKEKQIKGSEAVYEGDKLVFDGGYINVLYPVSDINSLKLTKKLLNDDNTFSLVLNIVDEVNSIYMMADLPKELEGGIGVSEDNKVVILKVGHHGSKNSTTEYLLDAIHPSISILSYGENNRYGHPHKEVTDLLNKYKQKIYRTTSGTIYFSNQRLD